MSDKNERWRRWTRSPGILALAVGIALLATACGGSASGGASGSSSTSGSSTYQKDLAFSECMRSHGVPNFPDPNSNGAVVFNANGGNTTSTPPAVLLTAQNACRHLLPNGGVPNSAQRVQNVKQLLKFVQCMRSHGEPNMPDPNSNGAIQVGGNGVNPQSPQFQTAQKACQSLLQGIASPTPGATP